MASLAEILARSHSLATQQGTDPSQSPQIDNLVGFRAMLNHVIRDVWRKKANDPKGYHDIVTKQTVAIVASTGTLPDNIMREFLNGNTQFQDANNSLITFFDYAIDYASGTTYTQLGYVTINGSVISYRAPAPNQSYTGNLFITAPTMPTIPASWSSELPISLTATDDVILALSYAMKGEYSFDGITDPSDGT